MSQADFAYTTSRLIPPKSVTLQRRQFVARGVAVLTTAAASRSANVSAPEALDPVHDAIEGHKRSFEELRCLLARQDVAERALTFADGGSEVSWGLIWTPFARRKGRWGAMK